MDKSDKEMLGLREKLREAVASGDDVEAARLSDAMLEIDRARPVKAPDLKTPASGMAVMLAAAGGVVFVLALAVGAGAVLGKMFPRKAAVAQVPSQAITDCEAAIKRRMQNPATVKFTLGGVSTMVRDNGGYLVRRTFKASNAFGMESEMRGLCVFPPGGGSPEVTFLQ